MPLDDINKLKSYEDIIADRIAEWESESIASIAKEVRRIGKMSKVEAQKYDADKKSKRQWERIIAALAVAMTLNVKDTKKAYRAEFEEWHKENEPLYDYRGVPFTDVAKDKEFKRMIDNYSKQTAKEILNLTDTKALTVFDRNGNVIRFKDDIYKAFGEAVKNVTEGKTDFYSSMRKTIQNLGGGGVRVDYGEGVTRRLDTVTRQNMLYGIKQANIEYSERIGEILRSDGYEIDAHMNSRPSHLFMQGKQYCKGESRRINGVLFMGFEEIDPESPDGLSASEALNDYGCRHYRTPIICGISEPRFTQKQLQEIKDSNAKIYEIDGKKGNGYYWSQKMRTLETEIRKSKDEINALKAFGNSEPQIKDLRDRIKAFQAKYDEISEVTGIAKDPKRLTVQRQTNNVAEIFRKQSNMNSSRVAISQRRFDELTVQAKKNGANIIKCNYGDEMFNHLESNNATASCIGKTILFRPDATISEVLEETRHFMQNIEGLNNGKPLELKLILNEIDAGEFILRNAKKYGVPRVEIEEIKQNVNMYREKLKLWEGEELNDKDR